MSAEDTARLIKMWERGELKGAQFREQCKPERFEQQGPIARIYRDDDGQAHVAVEWYTLLRYQDRTRVLRNEGRPIRSVVQWYPRGYSVDSTGEGEDKRICINCSGAGFGEEWEILLPGHPEIIAKPEPQEQKKAKAGKKQIA